jgi:hypothetical protein
MLGLNHVVLNVAPDSVLRAKQGSKVHLRMFIKEVSRVA